MLAKLEHETFDDGPDTWTQTTKLALRDNDGNIVGTWGFGRDVTSSVEAAQALGASQESLRASEELRSVLFEHNPQPMWIRDQGTLRVRAVNMAALAMYGYRRDEFLELTVTDLVPAADAEAFLRSLEQLEGESRTACPWWSRGATAARTAASSRCELTSTRRVARRPALPHRVQQRRDRTQPGCRRACSRA